MSQTPTTTTDVSAVNLSAFQKEILFAVAQLEARDQDPYALGIKQSLEGRFDEAVNNGRLYPNLDDLVEMGVLEKSTLDERTNEYRLSETGQTLLEEYHQFVASAVDTL